MPSPPPLETPPPSGVEGNSIRLRRIHRSDAAFVLSLRLDAEKSRYLHPTAPDLPQQEAYIEASLQKPQEWYFIIESRSGEALGTVRIYDVQGDSFCWGSWILKATAPPTAALESALLVYETGFETLGFAAAHFDVRKGNKEVLAFHRRMGVLQVREDEQDVFFHYPRTAYAVARQRFRRFLPSSSSPSPLV